jgi:hypothetical protein
MRRYGESKAHEKAKDKIANVLRSYGFETFIEYPFECKTNKGPRTYYGDVYAQNFCILSWVTEVATTDKMGARRIIVEVESTGHHNTKAAFNHDKLRLQDIRKSHGSDIEYYVFTARRKKSPLDVRNWSDEEITKELRII